jgi:hypothetical protein
VEESPFYEADALSDGQEIQRFEWNPKVTPHLCLGLSSGLFPEYFWTRNFVGISRLDHTHTNTYI